MTRTVLLVDPQAERRGRLAGCLRQSGYEIAGCASREEAIRLAAISSPAVTIMPTTLGLGTMRLSDQLFATHRVPSVLIAEGDSDPQCAAVADAPGVMGVLTDPIDVGALSVILEVALRRFQDLHILRGEVEQLRQTLEARKVIERAKGFLMEAGRLTEREAYARMRRKSMDTQRSMSEIAQAIILSAELNLKAG